MILIADSGSTKTTWMEVESGNKVVTEGLNPHFTTEEQFLAACATVRQQLTIHNSQFTFTVPAAVLLSNERRWPIGSPKPSEQAMCMSKPTCSPPAVPPLANDLLWWPSSAPGAMPAIMTANR